MDTYSLGHAALFDVAICNQSDVTTSAGHGRQFRLPCPGAQPTGAAGPQALARKGSTEVPPDQRYSKVIDTQLYNIGKTKSEISVLGMILLTSA